MHTEKQHFSIFKGPTPSFRKFNTKMAEGLGLELQSKRDYTGRQSESTAACQIFKP